MQDQSWDIEIRSDNKKINFSLRELVKCKDLILLFVRRTFVAQYKQTILGPAWAVIQPFFTTVVYSVFFGNIAGLGAAGVPNFIFYLCGTIMWTLFSGCLTHTSDTFVSNSGILGKVYFPRLVMPISTAISQFISFFIQFAFMLCFLVYYLIADSGVVPNLYILMTPVLLLQTAILGMGFGIIISSLTTKYRDLKMVVGFGVSLWSYCSPVAYDMFSRSVLMPGGKFYDLYMLNPVTPIVNMFRYAYLGTGAVDWLYYGISWVTTLLVLALGVVMFGKVEKTFMDTV
ncbi:MAG: ABC transporter permease [Clostridia bacterium]|nr:ABC transporter permease [Clostridia bacterium]